MRSSFIIFLFCSLFLLGGGESSAQTMIEKMAKKQIDKSQNKNKAGDVGKANKGKIVFSKEKIEIENPDESAFIQSAELGEKLFFRVYWEKPLENVYKNEFSGNAMLNTAEMYKVYFNDEPATEHIELSLNRTEGAATWFSTWGLLLYEGGEKMTKTYIYNDCLIKAIQNKANTLPVGAIKVRIENYIYNISANQAGKMIGSGEITLNVTETALQQFKKAFPAAPSRYPSCMPKPKQENTALEDELLEVVKDAGWPEEHRHVVIMDRDFVIARDEYTKAIADRSLQVAVGARKNGKCWYQTFVMFQPYEGGGAYSRTFRLSRNRVGEQTPVPCSCLFED